MKLTELLREEDYTSYEYKKLEGHSQEMENLFDFGVINEMDRLTKELERIPTQTEYIESGIKIAETFFKAKAEHYIYMTKKHHRFVWDEDLINSIKHRLARTYTSHILELHVTEFIRSNYSDLVLAYSSLIDHKFGADLVILNKEEGKLHYIHVAADTYMSRNLIKNKRFANPYLVKGGRQIYWQRNWNHNHIGHQMLFYDVRDEKTVTKVNGNYLFQEDYLREYFERLFSGEKFDVVGESEFEEFFEWMTRNGIMNH